MTNPVPCGLPFPTSDLAAGDVREGKENFAACPVLLECSSTVNEGSSFFFGFMLL